MPDARATGTAPNRSGCKRALAQRRNLRVEATAAVLPQICCTLALREDARAASPTSRGAPRGETTGYHASRATSAASERKTMTCLFGLAMLVLHDNAGGGYIAVLLLLACTILSVIAFRTRETRQQRQEQLELEWELERRVQDAYAEWERQRDVAPQPQEAKPRVSKLSDLVG